MYQGRTREGELGDIEMYPVGTRGGELGDWGKEIYKTMLLYKL